MRSRTFSTENIYPRRWPLVRRRDVWFPTWRGWLCVLALLTCSVILVGRGLHSFLAVSAPVNADVLVIEGWVPDYVLKSAIAEFGRGHYRLMVTSGGPRPRGYVTTRFPTFAEESAASLVGLGFPETNIVQAPGLWTLRRRTFHSAEAVRSKLAELGVKPAGLNVITEGTHARRTWTVFRRVCRTPQNVGVISCPSEQYDPKRWWASSEGMKLTLTEAIGWVHDFVFR